MTASPNPNLRRRWLQWLKWSLCAVVLIFVFRRAQDMWSDADFDQLALRPGRLVLAGGVYILGWLPSVWFWRRLLIAHGQNASWRATMCGYYCGHLGKYIPGKASVLLIRGGLLQPYGVRFSAAALTAAYETLALMGTGLALGTALLPWLVARRRLDELVPLLSPLWQRPVLLSVLLAAIACGAAPLIARILNRVARSMSRGIGEGQPWQRVSSPLLLQGIGVLCLSWWMHGLSLGLTISGVADGTWDWAEWPRWTGAVSLATSVGFLALFAPGGVGVREGILMELLSFSADVSTQVAVTAAVVLRFVWLLAELSVGGGLYLSLRGAAATGSGDSMTDPPPATDHRSAD